MSSLSGHNQAEESIRFQAHLLDTVEQSVIATDLDGIVIYWNRFAQTLYGWTAQEAMGRQIIELTTPEVMTAQALEIMARLRQGERWTGEFNVQRRDGTPFPVQIINSPINDGEGKLIGIVGVSIDITERKHTQILLDTQKQALEMVVGGSQLAEVLEYLAAIVEHQSSGSSIASILLLDEQGRLHTGAAPSLPEDYVQAIEGLKAHENLGTCSAAAATGKIIITPDIATDPKWQDLKHLPLGLGLQSAWSLPIVAADKRVLGTFGTYFREKREPTKLEREAVEILAKTAALAIERKQAEEALRGAHKRITNIFESITDCFYALDADWRFTYVNPQTEAYFNLPKEMMLGRDYTEVFPLMRDSESLAILQEAMSDQKPVQFEVISPTTGRWVDLHVFPAEWGLSVYFRDITERKRAEEELNASEERLRTIFEASRDGILVEDGERIVYVNQSYTRLLGYQAPEELIGKHVSSVISSEDTQRLLEFGKSRVRGKLPASVYEFKGKRKDGTLIEVEASVSISTLTGHSYITTIVRDITERKQAEIQLRESEERFRAMFEQANVGIVQASFEGRLLVVNPGFCHTIGYAEEEARGMTIRDITHPDDYEREEELTRRLAAGEIPGYVLEKRYIRQDGKIVWGQMTAALIREASGEPHYMLAVVEDITGRKRAEELLRASEAQLRTLFDEAPVGVYLIDADFRVRAVNPTALPVFGDIPDLIGRDFDEVIHVLWERGYADELVRLFRRTLETGEPYFATERIEERRDRGVTEYYEWQVNRIPLPEGGYGVVCYFRDVSASVFARQKIAESEEKYRTLFESIDEGFCIVEVLFNGDEKPVDYRFLEVSPSFERQTGIANAAGRRIREIAPQHEEYWFEIYGHIALTGEPMRFQNRAAQLHRFYDVYAFRIGAPEERKVAILFNDITERKQAEIQLRESEERFRAMFEQANVGIVQASFEGILLKVNPGFCKIVGYSVSEASGMAIRDITHPDDYEKEKALTRQLMTSEISGYSIEKRFVHKDGHLVWGQMTATLISQSSNKPFYMLSIVEDITERKQAEEALRISQDELQKSNDELERRVAERTATLSETNDILQGEVRERQRIETERVELLRRVIFAQENERRRIAREMHDQFGQGLSALTLKLAALKDEAGEQVKLREQLERLEAVANQLDSDVDFLVWELRPTVLDDLGLPAALKAYVQNWSKHFDTPAKLYVSGMKRIRLTSDIETVLYRITQEALNNIAKHARAGKVDVILEHHKHHVSLIVEDDGMGFDCAQAFDAKGEGLGLIGMRERAALVGGTVEIESHPNKGTTVFVRTPAPPISRQEEQGK